MVDVMLFQSTLPVWAATAAQDIALTYAEISIHAARVGSDVQWRFCKTHNHRFQSTLPVWAATADDIFLIKAAADFNPRCPCGQRQYKDRTYYFIILSL